MEETCQNCKWDNIEKTAAAKGTKDIFCSHGFSQKKMSFTDLGIVKLKDNVALKRLDVRSGLKSMADAFSTYSLSYLNCCSDLYALEPDYFDDEAILKSFTSQTKLMKGVSKRWATPEYLMQALVDNKYYVFMVKKGKATGWTCGILDKAEDNTFVVKPATKPGLPGLHPLCGPGDCGATWFGKLTRNIITDGKHGLLAGSNRPAHWHCDPGRVSHRIAPATTERSKFSNGGRAILLPSVWRCLP